MTKKNIAADDSAIREERRVLEGLTSVVARESKKTAEEKRDLWKRVIPELKKALGTEWVMDDPLLLDTYSWQYVAEFTSGSSYAPRPMCVVLPSSTEEVSQVVKICNRLKCQYKAISTGFGAWGSPVENDTVVQIDLRRMDHIDKIDGKNMVAVIEPYVTGNQLQTEAFKVGLNTHIAGVGAQASVLASATSMMGQSWEGVSMGFSGRNLLGVEWVLPDGEIARLGSFDTTGDYFSGDGPGFSLRGAMRGFGGAMGGLGVFTRCAVKLYPWYGPSKMALRGTSPDYIVKVPEFHACGLVVVNNWEDMAELGYKLGESEICDFIGRNAPALISGVMAIDNNEFAEIFKVPILKEIHYALMVVILAQDKDDYTYKIKTLKKIVGDLNGGMVLNGYAPDKMLWLWRIGAAIKRKTNLKLVLQSLPGLAKLTSKFVKKYGVEGLDYLSVMGYETMIRQCMQMRGAFKFSGSFHTSMGALQCWDAAIRGANIGEIIKKSYINRGILFDDGADNAWGGLYEGGAYSHLEELAMYDPREEKSSQGVLDYVMETNLISVENCCGDPINGIGPPCHCVYSPACMNYDDWQHRIKTVLDPNNASDAGFYTDSGFLENMPDGAKVILERVLSNRTKIDLEE
ncbi:MAG: FAD-dependent oxidoreductase [Proteobacteria bacterium]|nr:FAD-dependent oxidoreductase [Pseudomonadota bacterium]